MFIHSKATSWKPVRATNETSNGYRTIIPTATEPVTETATATSKSVQNIATDFAGEAATRSTLAVVFFGVGSNNNTFSARCVGWTCTAFAGPITRLWIPITLIEVTVTLTSTGPGVAATDIGATNLFADTLALVGTSGNANVTFSFTSPADNTIAHLTMAVEGCQKLEWIFTTGASATSCNALWRLL